MFPLIQSQPDSPPTAANYGFSIVAVEEPSNGVSMAESQFSLISDDIPDSFVQSFADYLAGKTVPMEIALSEPPPAP